jgi:hypothetical protein
MPGLAGAVENYNNQTYLTVIPRICSQTLEDLTYAGNAPLLSQSTYSKS